MARKKKALGFRFLYFGKKGFSRPHLARAFALYDPNTGKILVQDLFPKSLSRSTQAREAYAHSFLIAYLEAIRKKTQERKRQAAKKRKAKIEKRRQELEPEEFALPPKKTKPQPSLFQFHPREKTTDQLQSRVHRGGSFINIRKEDLTLKKGTTLTMVSGEKLKGIPVTPGTRQKVMTQLRAAFIQQFTKFFKESRQTERLFLVRVKTAHYLEGRGTFKQGIGLRRFPMDSLDELEGWANELMEWFNDRSQNYLQRGGVSALFIRGFSFEVIESSIPMDLTK